MSFEIVYTDKFERGLKRLAKKYRSIKKDFGDLLTELEQDPTLGTPVGNNCYKIRMAIASKGKGKSGGARLITHLYVEGKKVYLLTIYDKSQQETISDKELEILLKLIR